MYGQLTAVDGLILIVVEQQCKKERKKKHKRIILGAWNIRNLPNRAIASRPEGETALVARELHRYRVDIAALSETQIGGEGSLREEGGDYTFFWKGKLQAEDRIHSVGFVIRTALLRSVPLLPVGIKERLMKLCIPISGIRYFTIISAYAPSLTSPDDAKEQFWPSHKVHPTQRQTSHPWRL